MLGRDRVAPCHPFHDLLAAGTELTYASDWPAAAPDANPGRALPIFTRNGARAIGMGDQAGMIRAGNRADFIVLDRPAPDLSAEEIAAVEVWETHW